MEPSIENFIPCIFDPTYGINVTKIRANCNIMLCKCSFTEMNDLF